MNVKEQAIQDARALNDQLKRLELGASIDPKRCTPGGNQLAFFGIKLHGKTTAADVAKRLPELMRAISQSRRKRTYLRFDDMLLRLEAEHPAVQPLHWFPRIMERIPPHSAALGVSHHDGEQRVVVSMEEIPQILLAGETGGGKTVLLRNYITGLAYSTSPADLRMVLVDPKNEDLRPYAHLPHVDRFAGTPDEVREAVDYVAAEVQARVADSQRKPYRLLLIVDELAQLTQLEGVIKKLGNIMSIGRSKLINVMACTQQPTEEGGMGSMMKANVPLRLVGAVSAGQSYTATRRRNAGADMLPGKGAFLFIKGLELYRFQSYFMDATDERRAVGLIQQKWASTVLPTRVVEASRSPVKPVVEAPVEVVEPVAETVEAPVLRDEIGEMVEKIRPIWQPGMSKNALSLAAFDKTFAGTSWTAKVNAAISRLTSTESSTEPSTTASTTASTDPAHPSENTVSTESHGSSSRTGDNKIMRLPRTGTGGD